MGHFGVGGRMHWDVTVGKGGFFKRIAFVDDDNCKLWLASVVCGVER